MLVDLRTKYPDLTGKVAEMALVAADITVNKNAMVPFDTRSTFRPVVSAYWILLPSLLVVLRKNLMVLYDR